MPTLQEIQDATIIINAFEERSMNALSEESAFVPAARVVNMMKDQMKSMQKSFIPQSKLSDELLTQGEVGKEALAGVMNQHLGNLGLDSDAIKNATGDAGGQEEGVEQTDVVGNVDWNQIAKSSESYLRDCIPCIDRIKQLGVQTQILPFDIFNAILDDLASRMQWLWQILDMLGDTSVWDDTCMLMEFLSFMCVPDLAGLLTFLSFLGTKYNAYALSNMNMLPGFWISQAFYVPFMMAVYAVIARYIGQIKGIIRCISNSLQRQIRKLDVERPLNRMMDTKKDTPTAMSKAKADIRKTDKAMGDGLNLLLESMDKGFDVVDKEMREGADTIKNFLAGGDASNWTMAEYIKTKVIISRLIGFIRFMIEMAFTSARNDWDVESDGARGWRVKCGGPDEAYDKMLHEFEGFAREYIDRKVELERDDEGNVTSVGWKPLPDPVLFLEAGREYMDSFVPGDDGTETTSKPLTDDPDDKMNIRDKIIELANKRVSVSCSGMGELLNNEDSSKLQQWIEDLNK